MTDTTEHATLTTMAMRFGHKLGDVDPAHPRPEAVYWRPLDEATEISVYRMFPAWRVCYGERGELGCIDESYCYKDLDTALRAAAEWTGQGDPLDGWYRSPTSGRRRTDGDPAREELRW